MLKFLLIFAMIVSIHCQGFWFDSRIENIRNKLRFFIATEFNGCNQQTDTLLFQIENLLNKVQTVSDAFGISHGIALN